MDDKPAAPCPMCGYVGCWWATPDDDVREYDCDRCKAHGRIRLRDDEK